MSEDENKTVIVRRKIELAKPAEGEAPKDLEPAPKKVETAATNQTAQPPNQEKKDKGKATPVARAVPPPKQTDKALPASKPTLPKRRSSMSIVSLLLSGVVLVGIASALTMIYFLSPPTPASDEIAQQDLATEIVSVEDDQSAAEDEALIKAAIAPKIISLSGDPVIVRHLATAPRQLVKLSSPLQAKAAQDLAISADIYRFKDVLDLPDIGIASGAAGAQEDIASLPEQAAPQSVDVSAGASVIGTGAHSGSELREFAQQITNKIGLAEFLTGLGAMPERAQLAAQAFGKFYGRENLQKTDKVAVRAVIGQEKNSALNPVQISIYGAQGLVGSIAVDDIDAFSQSADPWAGRDIFVAELLPAQTKPEDRPRLLDAIYAAALRNRLPTTVIGETILLLSRAQDLEQKVQDGDTITLLYSPVARDLKTGLGRIVYVSIGRTTGNLECFAFQAQAEAQFECLSAGGESSQPEGAMVKPVNGVLVAKFGPQDQNSGEANMNYGVDWTAPMGTPVVAAYDGEVVTVGEEPNFGKVVRLSHSDGTTTMYAYFQRFEPGLVTGAKVKAGQTIGYVGTPATSREPRLHFELRKNDVPVDPVAEMQPNVGSGGVVDQFVHRIITIESANRCNARNPLSTAVGLGQFIEGTWMTMLRIHRPDLLAGRTRQQALDLRLDCNVSRAMTTAFTRDNAAVIRQTGHNVTPGNLYLAHFLGVGGAVKILGGNQGALISDVFGASHVRANPFEVGKSLGYLVGWAAKKMNAATQAPASPPQQTAPTSSSAGPASANAKDGTALTAAAGSGEAAFARYDANPAFTKLKNAVVAFLR